jgi:hypothetical protein
VGLAKAILSSSIGSAVTAVLVVGSLCPESSHLISGGNPCRPSQTPKYLLRGYFRMLDGLGDLPRMISCGTDLAHRNRMRDLSGGDAAALTEIIATQGMIVTREHPERRCVLPSTAIASPPRTRTFHSTFLRSGRE